LFAHSLKIDETLGALREHGFVEWSKQLEKELSLLLEPGRDGNLPRWLGVLDALPALKANRVDLGAARVQIGDGSECNTAQNGDIEQLIRHLHPWRKGPFDLLGMHINSEWRSDWKWERLAQEIQPLEGKAVLDVGCGNGYYSMRMAGAGAKVVVGVDPNLLFLSQFRALTHFIDNPPDILFLPVGLESVPPNLHWFDTVFSMGVLYHRRSPIDHLYELRGALSQGGELVLETLIIEGGRGEVLVPERRYAKMRNVWFIPTVEELIHWLERVGFTKVRCLDQSVTTTDEQRVTSWMEFESLADFLDPTDPTRTIEGYPSPRRALLSAIAP